MSTLNNGLVHASAYAGNIGDLTSLDITGNGTHMLLRDAPVNGSRDRLDFSGSDTKLAFLPSTRGIYRDAFDPFHTVANNFSFHCKVTVTSDTPQVIMSHSNNSGSQRALSLWYDDDTGELNFHFDRGGTLITVTAGTISLDTEYDVTCTYDQSTARVYLDDNPVVTGSLSGPLDEVTDANSWTEFGRRWDNQSEFEGTVRNIHLWRRVLDASEVATLHSGSWTPTNNIEKSINVAFLFGQSNGNGEESETDLTTTFLLPKNNRTLIADGNYATQSIDLHGFHSAQADYSQFDTIGAEVGLAEGLGEGWAIIKFSVNATSVYSDWQTAGSTWIDAEAHIQAALADLGHMGFTINEVVGVHIAGEADSTSQVNAEAFAANAEIIYSNIETAFGQSCKFVISRLSDAQAAHTPYVYLSTVQAQQDSLSSGNSNRTTVNTDDLTTRPSSLNHYDADSMLRLGHKLGRAAVELTTSTGTSTPTLTGETIV